MAKIRIQDGEHASLELFAARHRQRYRWCRVALHARDDVEQVLGVVSGACSTCQSQIIARALTLRTKLFRRRPDEWVEPVQRTSEPSERVTNKIVTTNVRQLVEQDRVTSVERPVVAFGGKNDRRRENAAGERHLGVFAAEKPRRLLERQTVGDFPEWSQPVFAIQWPGAIDDPLYQHRGVSKRCGDSENDHGPQE